jgi:hypothetical protein
VLAAARIRGFSVEDGEGRCPGEAARRALGTALRRAGMDSDRMGDCRFRVGDEIGARGCGAGYADV